MEVIIVASGSNGRSASCKPAVEALVQCKYSHYRETSRKMLCTGSLSISRSDSPFKGREYISRPRLVVTKARLARYVRRGHIIRATAAHQRPTMPRNNEITYHRGLQVAYHGPAWLTRGCKSKLYRTRPIPKPNDWICDELAYRVMHLARVKHLPQPV